MLKRALLVFSTVNPSFCEMTCKLGSESFKLDAFFFLRGKVLRFFGWLCVSLVFVYFFEAIFHQCFLYAKVCLSLARLYYIIFVNCSIKKKIRCFFCAAWLSLVLLTFFIVQ